MPRALKSGLTLLALLGLVVGGGIWGWAAFTQPLPERGEPPICVDTPVSAGSSVFPEQVIVSVFNASDRAGLAGLTADLLADEGFGTGVLGNAPSGTDVEVAEVWVEDSTNPAARLVRSYLGKRAKVSERASLGPGVTVVVGSGFEGLGRGLESAPARQDTTVCSPPGSAI